MLKKSESIIVPRHRLHAPSCQHQVRDISAHAFSLYVLAKSETWKEVCWTRNVPVVWHVSSLLLVFQFPTHVRSLHVRVLHSWLRLNSFVPRKCRCDLELMIACLLCNAWEFVSSLDLHAHICMLCLNERNVHTASIRAKRHDVFKTISTVEMWNTLWTKMFVTVCVCVCVCVYVCMCVCVCVVFIYVRISLYMGINTGMHAYIHRYRCMYTDTSRDSHTNTHIHTHTHME